MRIWECIIHYWIRVKRKGLPSTYRYVRMSHPTITATLPNKLKAEHSSICLFLPYDKRQSFIAMLHCIQIFYNAGQALSDKISFTFGRQTINYDYMCLCRVSTLFGMICCLSSKCYQDYYHSYLTFHLLMNVPSYLLTYQTSMAGDLLLFRMKKQEV